MDQSKIYLNLLIPFFAVLLIPIMQVESVESEFQSIQPSNGQTWKFVDFLQDAHLEGKNIFQMAFDSNGNAWLATSDGLYTYDGYEWERFGRGQGLPSSLVRCVTITRDGTLWVGTDEGAGIFQPKTKQFLLLATEDDLAGPSVRRIYEDDNGVLWFCSCSWPDPTVSQGIASFDPNNGNWTKYGEDEGLPNSYVLDIHQDSENRHFAGVKGGLARFDPKANQWQESQTSESLSNSSHLFWAFAESGSGELFVTAQRSLYRLVQNEWKSVSLPTDHSATAMASTRKGEVLLPLKISASQSQIFSWKHEPEEWEAITQPFPSQPLAHLEFITEAPDGSIWMGGYDYLMCWKRYDKEWMEYENLPPPQFTDFQDRTWFFQPGDESAILYSQDVWSEIRAPLEQYTLDEKGHLWLWSEDQLEHHNPNGVYSYSLIQFGLEALDHLIPIEQNNAWLMGRDQAGLTELVLLEAGTSTKHATQAIRTQTVFHAARGSNGEVYALVENKDGNRLELLRIHPKQQVKIPLPMDEFPITPGLLTNPKHGLIWIFGQQGLYQRRFSDEAAWERIPEIGGNHIIKGSSKQGKSWFRYNGIAGGQEGVACWNGQEWSVFALTLKRLHKHLSNRQMAFQADNELQLFDQLLMKPMIPIQLPLQGTIQTVAYNPTGCYWLSVNNRTLCYRPDLEPPNTFVTGNNHEIIQGGQITVSFSAKELFQPRTQKRNYRYSYQIHSKTWSPFFSQEVLHYDTGLLIPGEYVLKVRSRDQSMQVDRTPATFAFTVLPVPFQEQSWFLPAVMSAIVLTMVLMLICFHLVYRLVHIKHVMADYSNRLQETVQTQTQELRQNEEQIMQMNKMEMIGQLAGGIAHDFNNILTVIQGYCDIGIARRDKTGDSNHELIQIQNATERASAIIQQLLSFSRKKIIQHKILNLNHVIRSQKPLLERLIGDHIEFITHLDPELGLIKIDRNQLEQVIVNLIVNARDAMPKGGTLIVETRVIHPDDREAKDNLGDSEIPYASLTVIDTGLGMDQHTKARIFDAFFTTKNNEEATGLGLATVYGIVKQNKGVITVYSEPGLGATFKLYFPQVEDEWIEEQDLEYTDELLVGNETVLLVEDEENLRELVGQALESHGYNLITAQNGHEAIAQFQEHQDSISLLVSDVIMPGMDGRQMAIELNQITKKLRILFMSGYTDVAINKSELNAGEVYYLQKPFTLNMLLSKVREILDQSKPKKTK